MNKYSGKCLLDKIEVVCLLGVVLLCISVGGISGCGEQSQPIPTELVVELPNRLEVVSKNVRNKNNWSRAVILRDNFTGQEFLWVTNSGSTNVIPIGYDLEYIEKLNKESSHE